jgi:putative ABC transport system permease protein
MKPTPGWRPATRRPTSPRTEIEDEIRFHIEGRIEEFVRQGLPERDARARARDLFGDVTSIKASMRRETQRSQSSKARSYPMQQISRDIHYALRALVKHPAYTIAVVATLTLAIGATTAVFSVVRGVLLRPLPIPDPQQVVRIWEVDQRPGFFNDRNNVTVANYRDWREQNRVFEEMAAFQNFPVTLRGRGDPRPIMAGAVTAEFFDVMDVSAMMGRTYLRGDDSPDSDFPLILSHTFWAQEMGRDPDILGKTLGIGNGTFPIIGVLPESFDFLDENFEIWIPYRIPPSQFDNRRSHIMQVMARMRPGVNVEQAQADMNRILGVLRPQYPRFLDGWGINVVSLTNAIVGDVRPALLVLQGAVIVLLIIATVNVTNLMFARTTTEQRELAIRTALGASRRRLISQKLSEALVLASAGGATGLVLAYAMTRLLLVAAPEGLPMVEQVGVDWQVLLFALLITTASGLAFALAPALQAGRTNLAHAMNSRGTAQHRRHTRFRSGLVVTQLAFSLALLISAGLLVNTFVRLMRVDPGFSTTGTATMRISLSNQSYPTAIDQARFYDQILDRIGALPGVTSTGATRFLPMVDTEWTWSVRIQGQPEPEEGEKRDYGRHAVVADYFQTMNIALREGRYFNDVDRSGGPLTVIVNEAFVNRFLPSATTVVGQIMTISGEDIPVEIVGVVEDVHHYSLDAEPEPAYYVDLYQFPDTFGFGLVMNVVIRTTQDPTSVLSASRTVVRSFDPTVVASNAATMSEHVATSVARSRFAMLLLGTFAVVALVLAVVGVYGVVSYTVSQQTREIGVRLALGAKPPMILHYVMGHAVKLSAAGVVVGIGAAILATRYQRSLLFDVSPVDPLTYGVLSATLIAAAAAAAYFPARRASLTDPIDVLREE